MHVAIVPSFPLPKRASCKWALGGMMRRRSIVTLCVTAKRRKWPKCSLSGGYINKSGYFLHLQLLVCLACSRPSINIFLNRQTRGKDITDSSRPPPPSPEHAQVLSKHRRCPSAKCRPLRLAGDRLAAKVATQIIWVETRKRTKWQLWHVCLQQTRQTQRNFWVLILPAHVWVPTHHCGSQATLSLLHPSPPLPPLSSLLSPLQMSLLWYTWEGLRDGARNDFQSPFSAHLSQALTQSRDNYILLDDDLSLTQSPPEHCIPISRQSSHPVCRLFNIFDVSSTAETTP